jgi:hypothetical protein
MDLLISACFGAGVAAFTYSRLGRRVGYGNTQNIWVIIGVAFVLATAFFYSIIALLVP